MEFLIALLLGEETRVTERGRGSTPGRRGGSPCLSYAEDISGIRQPTPTSFLKFPRELVHNRKHVVVEALSCLSADRGGNAAIKGFRD